MACCRRRTVEVSLLSAVLAPAAALADGAGAGSAGAPAGSASAAVAEVIRAVQDGTAAIDEPIPGLDEVGGQGRRASGSGGPPLGCFPHVG